MRGDSDHAHPDSGAATRPLFAWRDQMQRAKEPNMDSPRGCYGPSAARKDFARCLRRGRVRYTRRAKLASTIRSHGSSRAVQKSFREARTFEVNLRPQRSLLISTNQRHAQRRLRKIVKELRRLCR